MKNQFLKTRLLGFAAFCTLLLGSMAGCAEVASSGAFVSIPSVSIQCTTGSSGSGCRQNTSKVAYVIYTTSGCTNPDFDLSAVSGSVTLNCTIGAGCSGSVTQFALGSSVATSIKEGFYSICVTIDMDGRYSGEAESGDMLSALNNVRVVSGTATQSVTSFSLKP